MADVRYALRSLLRARWFTVAAVLTFALGIGVNVAVFSTLDRLLFRSLPYADVDRLMLLRACSPESGECGGGFPAVVAFEGRALGTIDDIAVAGFPGSFSMGSDPGQTPAAPLRLSGVSANLLRVLGVQPVLGRDMTDEDAAQKRRVALISHESWQRRFGGAADVIMREIGPAAAPVTIVGVLPAGFIPPTWTAVDAAWDGLILDTSGWAAIRASGGIAVPVARLALEASVQAARAEIDSLVSALAPQLRGRDGALPLIQVDPIQSTLFSRFRENGWLILSASLILLMLACATLANLLLARGRSREYQAAIHASLGASPRRLMGTALLESVLVCIAGSAIAIGVVQLTSTALASVLPPLLARYAAGATDPRVLGFTLLIAFACAAAAGVLPSWRTSRVDVLSVLQRASNSQQRSRLRGGRSLIVVESALAVLLVLSGLLLVRSFTNFAGQDLGFEPEDLYLVRVFGSAPAPPAHPEAVLATYERALETLATVPGIHAAGGADVPVGAGQAPMRGMSKDRSLGGARYQVGAGYFATLRTPFIAGRAFTEAEVRGRAAVGILSQSAARAFFPDLSWTAVIGRRLVLDDEPARTVVGIVPDLKPHGYGRDAEAALFLPLGSEPSRYSLTLIRMESGATPQLALVQQRLSEVLGPVTVSITSVSTGFEPALQDPRFRAVLFTTLAAAALLLAGIGLYALASFDVAQRRYEMGVRLALGARGRDLQRMVISGACRPVVAGILLGLAGAWWAETLLASFLFGVEPRDPASYTAVVAVLLFTALVAAWLPARRAVRVDPATVLRAQ